MLFNPIIMDVILGKKQLWSPQINKKISDYIMSCYGASRRYRCLPTHPEIFCVDSSIVPLAMNNAGIDYNDPIGFSAVISDVVTNELYVMLRSMFINECVIYNYADKTVRTATAEECARMHRFVNYYNDTTTYNCSCYNGDKLAIDYKLLKYKIKFIDYYADLESKFKLRPRKYDACFYIPDIETMYKTVYDLFPSIDDIKVLLQGRKYLFYVDDDGSIIDIDFRNNDIRCSKLHNFKKVRHMDIVYNLLPCVAYLYSKCDSSVFDTDPDSNKFKILDKNDMPNFMQLPSFVNVVQNLKPLIVSPPECETLCDFAKSINNVAYNAKYLEESYNKGVEDGKKAADDSAENFLEKLVEAESLVDALKAENNSLREQLNYNKETEVQNDIEFPEWYSGEIASVIHDACEAYKATIQDSKCIRKLEILDHVLATNPKVDTRKYKQDLESALPPGKIDAACIMKMGALGFKHRTNGDTHHEFIYKDNDNYRFVAPATPSDYRSMKNFSSGIYTKLYG